MNTNTAAGAILDGPIIRPVLTVGLSCDTSRNLWAISKTIADVQRAHAGSMVATAFGRFGEAHGDAPPDHSYTCTFMAQPGGCNVRATIQSGQEAVFNKSFGCPYSGFVNLSSAIHSYSTSCLVLETLVLRNLAIHLRFEHSRSPTEPGTGGVWIFSGPTRSRKEAQRRVAVLEQAFQALKRGHRLLSEPTFQLPTADQLLSR